MFVLVTSRPRSLALVGSVLLAACHPSAPEPGAATARRDVEHVILVSIDGLAPAAYLDPDAHHLAVPTLRRLRADGAFSTGVTSVFPTMTYPAHTTIATGVLPVRHGIHGNLAFDPLNKNQGGWNWYAEDVKVPFLWDVADHAGLSSAVIGWPVTVGAHARYLVPDVWRARTPEDSKLVRALSTAHLLADVETTIPGFTARFHPPKDDVGMTDIAVHLIRTARPALLMLHLLEVDAHQHDEGVDSELARHAIEQADAQLARLVDAAEAAGTWDRTVLIVVSDHGFAEVTTRLNPGVELAAAGLVTLDAAGGVTDWHAALHINGGTGYIYVRDPSDTAAKTAVDAALAATVAKAGPRVAAVLDHAAIVRAGGDPTAYAAIEATMGTGIGPSYTGELISPSTLRGTHGWAPERPEMRASWLMIGATIRPGELAGARLVDVAPTVAKLLGIALPGVDGHALPQQTSR